MGTKRQNRPPSKEESLQEPTSEGEDFSETASDFGLEDDFVIDDDVQDPDDDNNESDHDNAKSDHVKGFNGHSSKASRSDDNDKDDVDMTANKNENPKSSQLDSSSVSTTTPAGMSHRPQLTSCFSISTDWSRLHLSRPLLKALVDLGFERPTTIQREAIPVALQGRDVLGTAQTGSGKTAAFLLPILERLCQSTSVKQRRMTPSGPIGGAMVTKALILLPTRELAVQCFEMLQALSKYAPITKILVTGGLNQKAQEMGFRHQPDIVVATPGRVLDMLLNSPSIHIELLEIVVLDEADRLLEMGFKDECLRILNHCSKGRQTLLFSATLSDAIKDLALLSLKRPLRVDASTSHTLPSTLEQVLVPVLADKNPDSPTSREAVLLHLCFESYKKLRTIIFFRTKRSAHRAALIFRLLGIAHAELHGNLTQAKRLEALETFHRNDSTRFLICSELAARGLDITHVDLVINFMVPPDSARYVHQVGRTARIGNKGIAVTLFSPEEKLQMKRVIKGASKGAQASVLKRTTSPEAWKKWEDKIISLNLQIQKILEHEHLERELRLAEMEASKATNMQLHQDEILTRPKKRWIVGQTTAKDSREDALNRNDKEDEQRLLSMIETAPHAVDDDEASSAGDDAWDGDLSEVDSGEGTDDSDEDCSKENTVNYRDGMASTSNKKSKAGNKAHVSKTVSSKSVKTNDLEFQESTTSKKRSQSEKNRQIKGVVGTKQRMTAKQKEALQAERYSRAIGNRVKKSSRTTRLRVVDGDSDDEKGIGKMKKKKFKSHKKFKTRKN